ncbi:MAG TPA: PA0069 family radical SAM protein [Steroidobacteraceae bacterium]|nr:PA0069 family radical SAM protein [Steroidobacteraceae bacterium]
MTGYKGRGALGNPPPRFLRTGIESVDDGWYREELPDSIATHVQPEPARSIISRNDSPDIPFEQSINPYRGCEHGCIYCLAGDTRILMADGATQLLEQIQAGDMIVGTAGGSTQRYYVRTQVLAHWSVIKPAYQITLEDGTQLVAGADHRFLTEQGWQFVVPGDHGATRRAHLTAHSRLMGTGAFAAKPDHNADYRAGYLCGVTRGRGLALCATQAVERAQGYLQQANVETECFSVRASAGSGHPFQAAWTQARLNVALVRELIAPRASPTSGWRAGFLAGIYDADGSYAHGSLRFDPAADESQRLLRESLDSFGFRYIADGHALRVRGGLSEHLRLLHSVDPAISEKRDISGRPVTSHPRLRVVSIESLGRAMRLYDMTTGTEDFIANGVVSHNCYARPSHAYMDLSPGIDFETRIFYKEDAARLLEAELGAPGYVPKAITLGANTDPYQPLEKELRVTRSIVEVLERTRHPVSFITKGTLILRDLDLLRSLAADQLVHAFVSITTLDAELKRIMEPRTASPQARLRLVRELTAAGIPTGVMVAPMIPMINDSEMEHIIEAAAQAGAIQAGYVLLRLPHELKELFREWLDEHFPDRAEHVMSLIRAARGGRENDARFGARMMGTGAWAQLLRDRFALACKRHGLVRGRLRSLATEHFRPPSRGGQMSLL